MAGIHLDATITGGNQEVGLVALLKSWSLQLDADFSFLEAQARKPDPKRPSLFANTRELLKGIPQLFWATVFGPSYVRLFGREKLATIPAAVNVELAPNLFYIQLTQRLEDTVTEPEMVDGMRQVVKEHLGLDAFGGAQGAAPAARIPSFAFGSQSAA